MPGARPNVVFLCLDAWCRSHTGAYGHFRPVTPHFDAFAAQNTLFWNAFSAGTWTPPAIASLLTGRLPAVPRKMSEAEHRDFHTRTDLATEQPLFAHSPKDIYIGLPMLDYMKQAWRTLPGILGAVGYSRYVVTSSPFLSYFCKSLVDLLEVVSDQIPPQLIADGSPAEVTNHSTERCWQTLRGISLVEPFFLYLHATQPHTPYRPKKRFIRYGRHLDLGPEEADLVGQWESTAPEIVDRRLATGALLRDDYDDNLAAADHFLGRILDQIEENSPDAWVFVFSDHGEHFYTDGSWYFQHPTAIYGKDMLDESLRVPLAARVPGWEPGRVEHPVSLMDLLPTILRGLDVRPPAGLDGGNLLEARASIRAVCPNLGRLAERDGSESEWRIREVPQSPPVEAADTALTPAEQHLLVKRMKALGYMR